MDNILTLLTSPTAASLAPGDVQLAADTISNNGGKVGKADWLAPSIACDLPFAGISEKDAANAVRAALSTKPIDIAAQAAAGRRKKLLVADMESTIIENEMLDELAAACGIGDAIGNITARAMAGELDFEAAIRARVEMLKGLDTNALDDSLAAIRITSGAAALVSTMRASGAYCALVSGGFRFYTAWVRERLGFDYDQSNQLEIANKKLTGNVLDPILGRDAKREALQRLATEQGISTDAAITVGDGANDLAMLEAAGLGVAFHAKPVVAENADARVDHGDLTALLYLQGYRQEEFQV